MKILVTGGGGFLGRYIVEQLLERGEKVVVWLVFKAAEELAQSTKSDVDDEFVAMVKQSFEDSKQRANNK